ncbi:carbohydrate ABC transporter permease [Cohnella thailandensis]|uniref:Sugar ABC transporter permease n=1 Tax=Cohnella thailandensis TaxID=557557 RepID=A0A841T2I4_9BACL|nr:sugar ABC transporter permease [Cohnella thailandensis]MBB6637812.1 sugar ABC transporter permease [Cohnella thailandensis]MBP1974008.1 ABC-type sugar transport system permease subunit [Cohnella thailandensis]
MRSPKRTFQQRKALTGMLFLAPWAFGFIFFFLVPLVNSAVYSFNDLKASDNGYTLTFEGWKNYTQALYVDATFVRKLTTVVGEMVVNVPLIIIFSLFIAVLLNQKFLGRSLARAIFFLPVILASGVMLSINNAGYMQQIMDANLASNNPAGASVNGFLQSIELKNMMMDIGVNESIVNYLTGAVDRIYEIISQSGVQIIIFLAGLQSISPQLYEASRMEGATGYEAFWKITFPMVSPLILTNLVYTIIDSFLNNAVTQQIDTTAFKTLDFGLSSAMAWIYFAIVAVILAISTFVVSRKVFYHD